MLWIYLLTATEVNQLWKFPIFVCHFIEHRAESPSITLGEFITLHYFSGEVRDADYARDEQLPFRDNTHSLIGSISTVLPPSSLLNDPSGAPFQVLLAPKTQEGKPCRYQTDIWQPPRVS